jgi:hypothetical protein
MNPPLAHRKSNRSITDRYVGQHHDGGPYDPAVSSKEERLAYTQEAEMAEFSLRTNSCGKDEVGISASLIRSYVSGVRFPLPHPEYSHNAY